MAPVLDGAMKLYEAPNKVWIRLGTDGQRVWFDHPDGMYSYCKTQEGYVCHLSLGTEITVLDDNTPEPPYKKYIPEENAG